jgi:large subunit ribosomal protein L6
MARLGKLPVVLPEDVKAEVSGDRVVIKGPKGDLKKSLFPTIKLVVKEPGLFVETKTKGASARAMQGTTRAHLVNMIKGVSQGWVKQLQLVGAGYRASVEGDNLVLTVGFSHPVKVVAPEGIGFQVEKDLITVSGIDKELVGQIAAKIRSVRPPDAYKGKGIRYSDEVVKLKPGKQAVKLGAEA